MAREKRSRFFKYGFRYIIFRRFFLALFLFFKATFSMVKFLKKVQAFHCIARPRPRRQPRPRLPSMALPYGIAIWHCHLWHCHMALPYGFAIWLCHMALPYGFAIWPCHMALPYGFAIWPCHMALPYGTAMWQIQKLKKT